LIGQEHGYLKFQILNFIFNLRKRLIKR